MYWFTDEKIPRTCWAFSVRVMWVGIMGSVSSRWGCLTHASHICMTPIHIRPSHGCRILQESKGIWYSRIWNHHLHEVSLDKQRTGRDVSSLCVWHRNGPGLLPLSRFSFWGTQVGAWVEFLAIPPRGKINLGTFGCELELSKRREASSQRGKHLSVLCRRLPQCVTSPNVDGNQRVLEVSGKE